MLACPVCGAALVLEATRFACGAGHHFDRAREGYVNLLLPHQTRRRAHGDDRESVAARARFLATGGYDFLADALHTRIAALGPRAVLDVGCGEGRFTSILTGDEVVGIDISRHAIRTAAIRTAAIRAAAIRTAAIRAAARSGAPATFAVASAAALPVLASSVDCVVSVMAPLFATELARVLRPGGHAVVVVPGERHLEEVRRVLYGPVVRHEVQVPLGAAEGFSLVDKVIVEADLLMDGAHLADLVTMTPYRWAAPHGWQGRLRCRDLLRTPASFVLSVWRRQLGPATTARGTLGA